MTGTLFSNSGMGLKMPNTMQNVQASMAAPLTTFNTQNSINPNYNLGNYYNQMGGSGTGLGLKAPLGWGNPSGNSNSILDFLSRNKDNIAGGVDLLQTLGGLYGGFKGLSLAKKQFQFQKDFAERNLANQTKNYNTELERRQRLNVSGTGWSKEEKEKAVQDYLAKHSL